MGLTHTISFSQNAYTYLNNLGRGTRSEFVNGLVEDHMRAVTRPTSSPESARIELAKDAASREAEAHVRRTIEQETQAAELENARQEAMRKEWIRLEREKARASTVEASERLLAEWKHENQPYDLEVAALREKDKAAGHPLIENTTAIYEIRQKQKVLHDAYVKKGVPISHFPNFA